MSDPPLGPGAHFEEWCAKPYLKTLEEVANFHAEIISIFQATYNLGAELGGDLALAQQGLVTTQTQLATTEETLHQTQEDLTLVREELAILQAQAVQQNATIQALNRAVNSLPLGEVATPVLRPRNSPHLRNSRVTDPNLKPGKTASISS